MDFKEIKYVKHYLYDSVEEFSVLYPGFMPVHWKLGKEGDWVLITSYAGSRIKIEDGELRIVNEDEIIATVDDPRDILPRNLL